MTATITSPHNEKLKLVRRLAERRGREREGLFATEGEDLLEAGLRAGAEPELLLTAAGSGLGGTEVEPEVLASASTLGSGSRAIALWRLPEAHEAFEAIDRCAFLDRVADPANVGAIVRSAAALLAAPVVLGSGCADPYSPKAVRASMGALFAFPPLTAAVSRTPRPRLGLVAHGGEPLDEVAARIGASTVCLGAERSGLREDTAGACDALAKIPLEPGAESLNVAASAAIAMYRISSAAGGRGGS
jgi:RNA methyltransferase, TrmH family